MDDSLQELYQDIILDHNKNSRNRRVPDHCSVSRDGYNPACGDRIKVYVTFENGLISDICFSGEGCAISQASASLMTEILKNKTRQEALLIIEDICAHLSGAATHLEKYGDVMALAGVKRFPMRIKCATLAWHAAKLSIESMESCPN